MATKQQYELAPGSPLDSPLLENIEGENLACPRSLEIPHSEKFYSKFSWRFRWPPAMGRNQTNLADVGRVSGEVGLRRMKTRQWMIISSEECREERETEAHDTTTPRHRLSALTGTGRLSPAVRAPILPVAPCVTTQVKGSWG